MTEEDHIPGTGEEALAIPLVFFYDVFGQYACIAIC